MRKCDVPNYLRESEFFRSLSDEDDSVMYIPDKFCKLDTNVSSHKELRQLLSTLRFWGLQAIPATCIKFVMEHFDQRVSRVLKEFENDYYLHTFMGSLEKASGPDFEKSMVECAARCDALEVLRYYQSIGTVMPVDALNFSIAFGKDIECFKFLFELHSDFIDKVCGRAASHGRLDILKFAHELGAPWGYAIESAAQYGHVDCMKYALERGCPIGDVALEVAAEEGHFDALKCLLDFDNGATVFPHLSFYAARGGIQCLQLVHERGYPLNTLTLTAAAGRGHLDCLKYAHEHGCIPTERVVTAAVRYGTVECFVYLREVGCPEPEGLLELAARWARIDHLKYMFELSPDRPLSVSMAAVEHRSDRSLRFVHSQGCPVDIEVMRMAARHGRQDSMKYLHKEVKITWDPTVTASAAAAADVHMLKYLHENGCPWDSNTCTEAARRCLGDCLQYAHQNGCPWDAETCRAAALTNRLSSLEYAVQNGCDLSREVVLGILLHPTLHPRIRQYLLDLPPSPVLNTTNQPAALVPPPATQTRRQLYERFRRYLCFV